jgi:hypothetical protein
VSDNAIFVTVNRADSGTYTTGSEVGSLPVDNLKHRQLTKVWRTSTVTASTTWFQVDLGGTKILHVFALLAHNISQQGKWRIRVSNESLMASTLYDTGLLQTWPSVGGFGTLPWGAFLWGGLLSESEAAEYTISSFHVMPSTIAARFVRVDISDSTNASTFIEAGRFIAGPSYQPQYNIQYGWELGYEDNSVITKSIGGQTYVDERERYRVIRFTLANLDEVELYHNVFDYLDRRRGTVGDVLFIPQPSQTHLYIYEAIYGRLRVLNPITHPDFSGRQRTFELEELI